MLPRKENRGCYGGGHDVSSALTSRGGHEPRGWKNNTARWGGGRLVRLGVETQGKRKRIPISSVSFPFPSSIFLIAFVYFPIFVLSFLLLSMIHMQEGGKQNEGWACPVVSHVRVTARGCTRPGSPSREGGGGCGEVVRGGLRCAGR
jgi:hypothetical protein